MEAQGYVFKFHDEILNHSNSLPEKPFYGVIVIENPKFSTGRAKLLLLRPQ